MKRSGFTLVELLLVAVIIGIVVAQLLPAIAGLRQSVTTTRALSSMRQHAHVFAIYASDYSGAYPHFGDPRATRWVIRCGSYAAIEDRYFGLTHWWHFFLGDLFYDGRCKGQPFREDSDPYASEWTASFVYGCAFWAAPEYWNPLTRREAPTQLRGVREAEVLSPSRKALLLFEGPYLDSWPRSVPLATVDGRAGIFQEGELTPPYANGDGDWRGTQHWVGFHGVDTVDGVRGADLRE